MSAFKKLGKKFKDLSPAAIREIIVVIVILCLSVAISTPQFFEDRKKAEIQMKVLLESKGFEIASPQKQGMDPAMFEEAYKLLENSSILSLTVIRNEKIVCEKYYSTESRNNVYSITKSIISALIGVAIREGYIRSVDESIETYLPQYFTSLKDQRWKQITIKHLLTMTPGFCEDSDTWLASDDWIKTIFDFPLQYDPGEKFQYANSASHLLSVVLTKATGMSTKDFADKYLFQPLDIVSPKWSTDPDGYYTGYSNIYLSPIDLAKFGWMYYSMGRWKGIQVVPEEWIAESTIVHYDFSKEQKLEYESGYGYKWWINGQSGYHVYSARGYGGQSINVIPDLGLEVVITCVPNELSINDEMIVELLRGIIKSCKK